MRKCNLRSGSALLIVLGMLTFLIVSAVGFSAYMRQGRLPSSQLRRTVAGRHLVKAAMAEAIDTIDQAINDNPHPGVGDRKPDGSSENINFWHNRIFMGTNQWDVANFANTVSPLSLEALAYIPPPLINDARYFSRLSLAAQWKSFDFDVGRYAFCAIDVSDYFDVNRLFANKRRSSAPHERVSLSYLFEKGKDHKNSASGSDAEAWDKFMEGFRKVDSNTGAVTYDKSSSPLISLADFNLAFHKYGGVGEMKSPFCEYLESGTGEIVSMGENEAAGSDAMLSRMTFVTDSLFPKTKNRSNPSSSDTSNDDVSDVFDLCDPKSQPLKVELLSKAETDSKTLSLLFKEDDIFTDDDYRKNKWFRFLGLVGMVSLYDYLDADRVPLSLAIPTTERVPMICAINPELSDMELVISKDEEPKGVLDTASEYPNEYIVQSVPEVSRTVKKVVLYKINKEKFFSSDFKGRVNAISVFPFSRVDEEDKNEAFTIDGQLKFFFSSQPMPLRTSDGSDNEGDVLHLMKEGKEELKTEYNAGIASINLKSKEISPTEQITQESDAIQEHIFEIKSEIPNIIDSFDENYLLEVTYEWDQSPKKDQEGRIGAWEPSFDKLFQEAVDNKSFNNSKLRIEARSKFSLVGKDGCKDMAFDQSELANTVKNRDKLVHFNCAIWLRVKKDGGKVVDMVPACLQDDVIQNKTEVNPNAFLLTPGDSAYPLMCFNTGVSFDFTILGLEALVKENKPKKVEVTPKAVMVADPRYNHSPEDWFTFEGEFTKDSWLGWLKSNILGKDGRDQDIFMATSDAGYLQSVYELAFLPRVKDPLEADLTKHLVNAERDSNKVGFPTSFSDSENGTKNSHLAWRTYDPFRNDVIGFSSYYIPFVNEGTGFKVNPYSDSTNVMMAVFANTPAGWRYSTTNKVENAAVDYSSLKIDEFNENYAFNAYSKDESSKVAWADLEGVAGEFMHRIRENPEKDWEGVFTEKMDWFNTAEGALPGMDNKSSETTAKFWGVDKKFLYGFWKDCFAVKQQLFLVFVRAEPAMMGSGATGHTPPQLGGKAVALVWRDPTKSTETNSNSNRAMPHKTRVLFYRQFE